MLKTLLISCIITLSVAACGGSSNSSETVQDPITQTPTPMTYTGMFLDAAVEGLNYSTASQTSKTGFNGEFLYQLDEEIIFSIGDIVLPSVLAKAYITPLDIYATDEINQVEVVNLLRLLQSLDVDGDTSNNIQISETSHQLATGLNIDFSANNFDQQVAELVANSGALNTQLISADMAIEHFLQTLAEIEQGISACDKTHASVGYSGYFETFHHNVSGKATIIDDCTIEISQFSYDGGGPDVYLYGAINHSYSSADAFAVGQQLNGQVFNDASFVIKLPNDMTLDDLTGLSVWCVAVGADFGHMEFTP